MKLMFETVEPVVNDELILEAVKEDKKYYIRGIYSTIGQKNRNKRIYSRQLWEREVNNYQDVMKNGDINSLMEWQHPPRSAVDPMESISRMTQLFIKDGYVMGESILLDNPKANQIKTLIDNNIKISVSSRSLGSVNPDGTVKDFKLITFDVVPDPSDYNATMNGLCESFQLNEGIIDDLEFDENGKLIDLNEKILTNKDIIQSLNCYQKEKLNKLIKEKFKKIFV